MTDFTQVKQWIDSQLVVILAVSTLAAILIAVALKRRGSRLRDLAQTGRRRFSAGTLSAVAAFVICTSVSLNTSFRFTGDPNGLKMTSDPERLLACAAFESLMAMCVLGARERMADTESRSGGWYGSAVWVFAALSAVPAWEEGNGFSSATAVRIIVGSFGSALAAHSALGLELRHRTGDESQTAMAQIVRDLRERLMARLGLAHRSRSAEEIARDRAMDKAVDLYDRYSRRYGRQSDDGTTAAGWRARWLARRLAIWQDRAELATDEAQRELYRARVAQRQYATALHINDAESPWSQPTAAQTRTSALDTLAAHARHMEDVATEAEDAVRAQIGTLGTLPAAHGGTSVPSPRAEADPAADEEPADCVELPAEDSAADSFRAAAAHGGTLPIVTARVPQQGGEDDDQEEEQEPVALRPLSSYPTKRAALEALYAHRISASDPRTTNAIAEQLRAELADAGVTLDRGPANRYVGALRPEPQPDETATENRELATV
ncbi:hypothetical protein [Streptomyces sp. IB2014 011-1]|uniref:hypothetical protein n=1 Tax=Streptomyces sp. IB2014 011-1 TaxID=1844478 RepID=UPI000978EBFE|nr:hypothetical protein [Streptomyces sp. IB2014 011-1]ONI48493.1 hypothetical protein STIB_73180 [Streptomyces sp. IB2014 011-1]